MLKGNKKENKKFYETTAGIRETMPGRLASESRKT